MNPAEGNRAMVREAFSAWAAGRGSVFDLLADDAAWTMPGFTPGAGQWRGRQAYNTAVTPLFEHLSAPANPDLIGLWPVGDEVIVRWHQDTPLKTGGSARSLTLPTS